MHAPAVQREVVPKRVGQGRPQPPHVVGSESVSASQPFDGVMSQSTKPESHAKPHALSAQVAVAFATAGQGSHEPQ